MGLQVVWEPSTALTLAHATRQAVAPSFRAQATTAGLQVGNPKHAAAGGESSMKVALELVELPWLTSARKFLRRPPRARILALLSTQQHSQQPHGLGTGLGDGLGDVEPPGGTRDAQFTWATLVEWVLRDDPPPLPAVHFFKSSSLSSSFSRDTAPCANGDGKERPLVSSQPPTQPPLPCAPPGGGLSVLGLREVVLGVAAEKQGLLHQRLGAVGDALALALDPRVEKRCHNVFPLASTRADHREKHRVAGAGTSTATIAAAATAAAAAAASAAGTSEPAVVFPVARVLPSPASCLVFQVPSIEDAQRLLHNDEREERTFTSGSTAATCATLSQPMKLTCELIGRSGASNGQLVVLPSYRTETPLHATSLAAAASPPFPPQVPSSSKRGGVGVREAVQGLEEKKGSAEEGGGGGGGRRGDQGTADSSVGALWPGLGALGVEIRLCAGTQVQPVFNEGQRALFEGVIVPPKPPANGSHAGRAGSAALAVPSRPGDVAAIRVAGSTQAPPSSVEEVGDCWMEFRAMVRRPAGFIRK